MPKLTNNQKGRLGENLIQNFSKVSPEAHPLLHKILINHLMENHEETVSRCDKFSLKIVSEPPFVDEGEEKDLKWRYQKGEAPKNDEGRPISYEDTPAWRPDAIIVANFSKDNWLMTFRNIEYPIEIKTGNRAELDDEQREAFIHASETIEGLPLLLHIDISDLPERYDWEIKRYVTDKNEIRKFDESKLSEYPEIVGKKLL